MAVGTTAKMIGIALAGALSGAAITTAGFLTFDRGEPVSAPTVTVTSSGTSVPSVTPSTTGAGLQHSGVIPKKMGERAAYGCASASSCRVDFTLDKVTDCTGSGYHGDAVGAGKARKLVWFTVRTGADFGGEPGSGTYTPTFSGHDLHAADAAGAVGGSIGPSTFWDCAATGDELARDWAPGQTYVGAVEVHLPVNAKKFVLTLGQLGWSWDL